MVVGNLNITTPWTKKFPKKRYSIPVKISLNKDLSFEPLINRSALELFKIAFKDDYQKKVNYLKNSTTGDFKGDVKHLEEVNIKFDKFISGNIIEKSSQQ